MRNLTSHKPTLAKIFRLVVRCVDWAWVLYRVCKMIVVALVEAI